MNEKSSLSSVLLPDFGLSFICDIQLEDTPIGVISFKPGRIRQKSSLRISWRTQVCCVVETLSGILLDNMNY